MKKPLVFLLISLILATTLHVAGDRSAALVPKQDTALSILNSKGEHVGTITNVLADPFGNIRFIIISVGEKEKKEIAIPLEIVSTNGQQKLVLDVDRDTLQAAPEFKVDDLTNPNYAGDVYRFFGMGPPWAE
jgi:hypothetical protein